MDRLKIEQISASIAVTTAPLAILGNIVLATKWGLNWEIFSDPIETTLRFIIFSTSVTAVAALILNFMLNLSLIASAAHYLKRSWQHYHQQQHETQRNH